MNAKEQLEVGKEVFNTEAIAIKATQDILGDGFLKAVNAVYKCRGKLVTMGIGKSGLVARKIAATLSSTGTQAMFVHPVECMHGDMGMINSADIAIVLSKSGESDEIRKLSVFLKNRGILIIAITEFPESHIAKASDIVIPFSVPQEACPMGMAPMASTTVQMVIGDAIAAVLIRLHDFQAGDFAEFHPAGSLGKRLLLQVSDLMHSGEDAPIVLENTSMKEALVEMTSKAMGAVIIASKERELVGIITDGDLRRAIQGYGNLLEKSVNELMTQNPISVSEGDKAIDALRIMENRSSQISVLPVISHEGHCIGILRLHDLVIAGL